MLTMYMSAEVGSACFTLVVIAAGGGNWAKVSPSVLRGAGLACFTALRAVQTAIRAAVSEQG